MVNYTLKFKNNLKLKTILPIFWNYSLFTTIFNSLINDPQHIILFSSMQQNKLDKVKKFLFYKLKSLKFKITLKKLLLYKKNLQFITFRQIFLLFISKFFSQFISSRSVTAYQEQQSKIFAEETAQEKCNCS